jgi:predicted nucleic acid-binding protein
MSGLTYDAGALIAAARDDRRVWSIHARALAKGRVPVVPTVVLVEVCRAGQQASLERFLKTCQIESLTEQAARAAGAMLGACRIDVGAVDAAVVECALRRGDAVVTSNITHLEAVADGIDRKIALIAI